MEQFIIMIITIILVILIATIDEYNDYITKPTSMSLALFLGVISTGLVHYEKNNVNYHTYLVKELEKNTVFSITDSIGGFDYKDSVWVNMDTRQVDTIDSTAMKCVIIKEIKQN